MSNRLGLMLKRLVRNTEQHYDQRIRRIVNHERQASRSPRTDGSSCESSGTPTSSSSAP